MPAPVKLFEPNDSKDPRFPQSQQFVQFHDSQRIKGAKMSKPCLKAQLKPCFILEMICINLAYTGKWTPNNGGWFDHTPV